MEGALNPRHVSHTQAPDKKRTTPRTKKKQIPTTKNNDPRFEPEHTTAFLPWNRPVHCKNKVVCSFSAPSHPALDPSPGPPLPLRTRANDHVVAVESSGSLRKRGRLLLFGTLAPRTRPSPNQSKRQCFCCGIVRLIATTRSFAPFRHPHTVRSETDMTKSKERHGMVRDRIESGKVRCEGPEKEQTTFFSQRTGGIHSKNAVVCSGSKRGSGIG